MKRPLYIAIAIYAGLSAWLGIASKAFLEADGITHYLARRFAISQPVHLVGVWSRPLCVALYCIPSKFGGLIGTRLMSLVLVLLMLPMIWHACRRIGLRQPVFACFFLLTQPLLFAHSFSELTEVPFALLVLGMFLAYQARWFGALAILGAIAPLARPEGFGLLLVVTITLILHRRFLYLLVMPLGLAAWSYAGWVLFGGPEAYPWWKWLPHNWPYSPNSVYGHGSFFWLTGVLPAVIGPIGFGFAVFGVLRFVLPRSEPADKNRPEAQREETRAGALTLALSRPYRERGRFLVFDHDGRCLALIALIPLSVLFAHSVLWARGMMASNGEPRYLLVAAPFWAMLSAIGLEWAVERFNWKRPRRLFVLAAAIPILANLAYPCFPLGMQDDDRLAVKVVDWLHDRPDLRARYPLVVGYIPHLFMRLDIDKENYRQSGDPSQEGIAHPKPGELAVWDSIYSMFNSDDRYCVTEKMLVDAGWVPIQSFEVAKQTARVYVSPADVHGKPYQ